MRNNWRSQGLSENECDMKMEEFLAVEGQRFHLEKQGKSTEEIVPLIEEYKRKVLASRAKRGFAVRS